MKTKEEILKEGLSGIASNLLEFHSNNPIKELSDFAAQSVREDRESRWISVKDGLPEESQRVLGFDGMNYFDTYINSAGDFIANQNDGDGLGDYSISVNVTHWQPLPSPPINQ